MHPQDRAWICDPVASGAYLMSWTSGVRAALPRAALPRAALPRAARRPFVILAQVGITPACSPERHGAMFEPDREVTLALAAARRHEPDSDEALTSTLYQRLLAKARGIMY